MKKFNCIIFDFDGTLADTAAGILATVKETFRRLGFQGADDERIRPTIGLVLEQSLQQIGDLSDAQTRDAARLYREIFPEYGEVVTATDRLAPKPAPDMVLKLLARMNQPAGSTLVVGDTVYDLLMGS